MYLERLGRFGFFSSEGFLLAGNCEDMLRRMGCMFESILNICIICKTEEVISLSTVRLLCQFGVSFSFGVRLLGVLRGL